MSNNGSEWSSTLVHLLALAAKLEGEGQYNNAKLARAAAEALQTRAQDRYGGRGRMKPASYMALSIDLRD